MKLPAFVRASLLSLTIALGISIPVHAEAEQRGVASYYGGAHHGRLMANGERFDQNAPTVAHRSLPLGARVCVTNLSNDRRVCGLTVTDRGPYIGGRIIDVSKGVARRLDMIEDGTTRVALTLTSLPPRQADRRKRL